MTSLTEQAIADIKAAIVAGEFAPGQQLPTEHELAEQLGLSRNTLREAVRALSLMGVLEPRVGDGTYVTSLEPGLLLAGMGFVSDLLQGRRLVELHQVRRILEPVATARATARLTDADFDVLEASLAHMERAESIPAYVSADLDFHNAILAASGNATLAALLQHLSGRTVRARLWPSEGDDEAAAATIRRHRDILEALRARDPARASAAMELHLAEAEFWLERLLSEEPGAGSP